MATSSGSVVMLVITPGTPSIGPGAPPECQPTTLMPCATACSISGACSRASIVPRMIPAGWRAMAWVSAEARVDGAPCPSSSRNSQPIASAASFAPSPTPLRAAVPLVVRHIDDELARLRLRAGRRAGPCGHRRRHRLDIGLRLRHEGVVLRPCAADAQTEYRGRSKQRPTGHTKSRHTFPPFSLLASRRRLARPVPPAL